jgi:hypothetical protein
MGRALTGNLRTWPLWLWACLGLALLALLGLVLGVALQPHPCRGFDVCDPFSAPSLSPVWCQPSGDASHHFGRDSLLTLQSGIRNPPQFVSIAACLEGQRLQRVEAPVAVLGGEPEGSTGLVAEYVSLDGIKGEVYFGMYEQSDLFLKARLTGGEMTTYGTWPGPGLGETTRLRIEWRPGEARFFSGRDRLATLDSGGSATWFRLRADSTTSGAIESTWDWVGWDFE